MKRFSKQTRLNNTENVFYSFEKVGFFNLFVINLENSKNWFLLCCSDVLEDKLVLHIRHYSGEERKETFSYNLKISNAGDRFSRSMSGVCTPFDMEINDARTRG